LARTVAVANQKGGVAKTTTVASLGVALARLGVATLLVDLDPQAALTFSLGLDPDELDPTVHDVLLGRVDARKAVREVEAGLDLLPANLDLAGAEPVLLARTGREYALRSALRPLARRYDRVLVDCPPSLGVLTLNALTAADEVIVPLQPEALSHRGVAQLLEVIGEVRRLTNRRLEIRGVLPTLHDPRTNLGREVLGDVTRRYNLKVLNPPVRRSIRFAEAPREGLSIFDAAPDTPGARAYLAHARRPARR
jgi:chromosome partitioning protein